MAHTRGRDKRVTIMENNHWTVQLFATSSVVVCNNKDDDDNFNQRAERESEREKGEEVVKFNAFLLQKRGTYSTHTLTRARVNIIKHHKFRNKIVNVIFDFGSNKLYLILLFLYSRGIGNTTRQTTKSSHSPHSLA